MNTQMGSVSSPAVFLLKKDFIMDISACVAVRLVVIWVRFGLVSYSCNASCVEGAKDLHLGCDSCMCIHK